MISLTPRQADLLSFIRGHIAATGGAPTYRAIRQGVGIGSQRGIARMLASLEERGAIRRSRNVRCGIEVLDRFSFIAVGEREAGRPTAYRGPYPIRSHRTCADIFEEPAPAQSHEAEALVGPCVQTLSSHTGSVAIGFSHVADSKRQSVDNATGSVSNTRECFVPNHEDAF